MRFGPVPVAEAEGHVLAHAAEGRPGDGRIPKGTVLTADHIGALIAAGRSEVIVARLDPGDVDEDAAADRFALAIAGPGLEPSAAGTGRVNLRARGSGIVAIDTAAIDAANRVDPGITVATVPSWQRLPEGGLAATIKIIPFAVPGDALDAACAQAAGAMTLLGPALASATLIETRLGAEPLPDKGRRAMAARLDRFGVALSERVTVPHAARDISEALRAAPGELLLILTASATSDVRDVAPEGVRGAGGCVIHYGMPVDPGNLLFLGMLGDRPVIGLPGCARSPALNGADWVLERVICGQSPCEIDIPAMGVGGLLKEIPTRPQPRERRR
ncbi:molybdopterin-binding protein [Jannaschia seohaensis]|uniref:Molybdenum cofactor cytidylyltransferase n=1 Tax=Jannaschia seohaensis TaxID=475081 RepID=A0A2Y9AQG6_9RHOB|nr:molybdopterin-binding protein [Jannaschia seohaensis]PWJ18099.1 molybdenum cofactor cytidylyltransferase [Jannaschia seohaensis]SSA46624.1 molybdenum cofactor cytidylyltransferase [Jannaschia seohaensis]